MQPGLSPRAAPDDPHLPLSEEFTSAVSAWLHDLRHERGHAEKTIDAYARDLRQFLEWWSRTLGYPACLGDLANLEPKTFRSFLAARRKSGMSETSLALDLPNHRDRRSEEHTSELQSHVNLVCRLLL